MPNAAEAPRPRQHFYTIENHPSAAGMPLWMLKLFGQRNNRILENHRKFGERIPQTSLNKINEAADLALERASQTNKEKPKKALILGAGNCTDIPLEDITKKFDKVTIVEADRKSIEAAVERLDPELQGKINIVIADVTGIMGEITDATMTDEATQTVERFGDNALRTTQQLDAKNKPPDLGNDYDFVCSNLIMSQLAYFPYWLIQNTAEDIAASPVDGTPIQSILRNCINILKDKLGTEHIRYLARSVAPTGVVYFADTYKKFTPTYGWQTMFKPEPSNATIHENFVPLIPRSRWIKTSTPDSAYQIKAIALERR